MGQVAILVGQLCGEGRPGEFESLSGWVSGCGSYLIDLLWCGL